MIWRFRPLIRGFFFYSGNDLNDLKEIETCFRPLIRGFFFYMHDKRNYPFYPILKVSVPSFGDSFLSSVILEESAEEKEKFPSPHSGILFYIL